MKQSPPPALLFTCEHASNRIPTILLSLFEGKKRLLESHRGWDPGAQIIANYLANAFHSPVLSGEYSRLAIDLNRSINHRDLLSPFTRNAPLNSKAFLINRVYLPFRSAASQKIEDVIHHGGAIHHYSIHSFTPKIRGVVRRCDIGILYDPSRSVERKIAMALRSELSLRLPKAKIRFNYPYRGTSDGHTSELRKRYINRHYAGIEIEFNQAYLKNILSSGTRRNLFLNHLEQAVNSASHYIKEAK